MKSEKFPRGGFIFLFCIASSFAATPYLHNERFHNVAITNDAATRVSWVTNSFDWSRAEPVSPGISYLPIVLEESGGWPRHMVGHAMRIDVTTPNLRFTGVDRCKGWGEEFMPETNALKILKRTVREKTGDFMARYRGPKSLGGKERDMRLGFNAAAWSPWSNPFTNLWGNINGPFYADGIQISGLASGYGTYSNESDRKGIFTVFKNGEVDVVDRIDPSDVKKIWFSCPAFVFRLVTDGVPNAALAADKSVRPRTAIGISRDRKTVYVLVVDGDFKEWSDGADFGSLTRMMAGLGAWQAINLDGGGSSNMVTWDLALDRPRVMGRPHGFTTWEQRPNGSNAGIYYAPTIARIGDFNYDDMDVLLADIEDGETPEDCATIDVIADAEFSAKHPFIPAGTNFVISSSTGASVGWADGVEPRVASGSRVKFENIKFRDGSRTLRVAAGGVAVFGANVGLDCVIADDANGLVFAAVPDSPIRVSCPNAAESGSVFAHSPVKDPSETALLLEKIVCADGGNLVPAAKPSDNGGADLFWTRVSAR